ncbi:hypothetical protein JOM56_012314, partial [Amanita muscaria]
KPESERDQVFENAQIINSYLALYEELSYAMNFGDIGRVETCLVTWIPLFKATGKHIYATHLEQFLLDMHFKYPEGLRHSPHAFMPGRTAIYSIPDMLDKGHGMMMNGYVGTAEGNEDDDDGPGPDADDIIGELL